jgi:UDP-2,3-diacylglucosamine hydrolase
MLTAPCFIMSDAHLGAASPVLERGAADFFRHVRARGGSLVINGDLFDFWFEWRSVIPRGHVRTLGALAELRDSGVPVLMLGGNHDSWGGETLTREIGLEYRLDAWDGTIAGWRTHIAHGDGLRPVEDRGYRRWRWVLRSPFTIRAFRMLHPDFSSRVAHGTSDTSRAYRAGDEGAGLQRVALEHLAAHPEVELVIYGHAHATALLRAPTGGVYANSGAWMDGATFLIVHEDRIELRRWTGSAEGDLLDTLDRRAEKSLAHVEESRRVV